MSATIVQATVYTGLHRDIEHQRGIELLADGVGRTDCFECYGDGDWTKFHPDPALGPFPCLVCKGTGKVLISM